MSKPAPSIDAARLKVYFNSFTWNRNSVSRRAADLPGKETPGFTCDKMARAWRNRSPVTSSPWWNFSHEVAGNTDYAGCFYAACGEFAVDGIFTADSLTSEQLAKLAKIIVAYIRKPPEKALSRGQYETHRRENLPKDQICHILYDAIVALRTQKGPAEHNQAVRSAKLAESIYRRRFRPNESPRQPRPRPAAPPENPPENPA